MSIQLTWHGNIANQLAKEAAKRGLREGAEVILTESIDETPIDSGTLRRSGTVSPIQDGFVISYNTPYAVKQHEDFSLNHTDGKAKYLEDPFNRLKPRVLELVQQRINQALG